MRQNGFFVSKPKQQKKEEEEENANKNTNRTWIRESIIRKFLSHQFIVVLMPRGGCGMQSAKMYIPYSREIRPLSSLRRFRRYAADFTS